MPHRHPPYRYPTVGEWIVEQARQLGRQQEASGESSGQPGQAGQATPHQDAPPQAGAGDSFQGFVYEPQLPGAGEKSTRKPSRRRRA